MSRYEFCKFETHSVQGAELTGDESRWYSFLVRFESKRKFSMGRIMAYWLFKSEPGSWSWSDQVAKNGESEEWDGIRNYQARNYMRSMKVGDLGFFYHSQSDKAVVGIVEVTAESHQDSTTEDSRWDCVDVREVAGMPRPVTLAACKADERLKGMVLVNNTRLSVQPVTDEEWRVICELGGYSNNSAT